MAGFAHVMFADMKHLLDIGLQIMFYATPIFIPADEMEKRGLAWLVYWNPAAYWLDMVRQPLLNGVCPSLATWSVALATTGLAFALAVLTLVRLQRRLI